MSLESRFWPKVRKLGPDDCWPWLAATNEHGYGVMRPEGRRTGPTVKAHRVAALLDGRDPAVKAKLVPPDLLHRVQPSPPASGRKPPAEGKAFLACVIEPDGSVSNVRVLSTSGNRDFDASSLEAVRQWRYSPPSLDGAPVRLFNHVTTSYRFH